MNLSPEAQALCNEGKAYRIFGATIRDTPYPENRAKHNAWRLGWTIMDDTIFDLERSDRTTTLADYI